MKIRVTDKIQNTTNMAKRANRRARITRLIDYLPLTLYWYAPIGVHNLYKQILITI